MGFLRKIIRPISKLPVIGDVLSVITGANQEATIAAPTTSSEDVAQAAEEERLRKAKARGRASTILMGNSGTEGTTASATLLGG